MPKIGSWIREKDEENFQAFVEGHPEIELLNARRGPVDAGEIDGLILTGGPDVSLGFLKQEVADASVIENPQPERDEWEFAALRKILEAGKPIFAICKGVQVLNVGLGGTLHLDIPGHALPEQRLANIQPLRHSAAAKHRLALVNSSHHQALNKLGAGLEVEAWCATDDVIEQVKKRDYPYCFGVQYHPERDRVLYKPLFEEFFAKVKGP